MTDSTICVLLLDDNLERRAQVCRALSDRPELTLIEAPGEIDLEHLLSGGLDIDAIVTRLQLDHLAAPNLVRRVRSAYPGALLILLVGEDEVQMAVDIVGEVEAVVLPAHEPYLALLPSLFQSARRTHLAHRADASAAQSRPDTFSDSQMPMLVLNAASYAILDANPAACAFFEHSHDELVTLKFDALVDCSLNEIEAHLPEVLRGGILSFVCQQPTAQGVTYEVEVCLSALPWDGHPQLLAIVHDVTPQSRAGQIRRESEAMLRAIVENTTDTIYIKNPEGRYVMVNPAMARFLDRRPEEILGKLDEDLFGEEIGQQSRTIDQQVMTSGPVYNLERKVTIKGREYVILTAKFPYVSPEGELLGVISISRDITERATAEEARRESEERFRHIFEDSPLGMAIVDLQLRPLQINATLCQMLGYTEDELRSITVADVIHRDDIDEVRANACRLVKGEIPVYRTEKRLVRKDGMAMWGNLTSTVVRDAEGLPLYAISMVEDITTRKQVQAALRESEDRFKRIAENAPDMIFRWSYARGFEYVSRASTDVIGYTPEEHYADPGLGYRSIHIDDLPVYESVFSDLADPEGPRRYCVIRWHHKDGHLVHVEMRMTPIFDSRGNLIAIEGIARDISQHVIARARLSELTTRLTQAHEDERRRIAHELHDEIGQALTVAKMRVRMVKNAIPAESEGAHEKLDTLSSLIDETLQTVRALSHELRPPLLEEMGWEPALASLCESFSQRTSLPVQFISEGPPGRLSPVLELTAYRVVQEALTNIVRHANAQHALVHAQFSADQLTIVVEDDGDGFDLDALTHADRPNVGLGLLGMKERVDNVGGRLDIDTAPGTGTRLKVSLPTKERSHETDQGPAG